MGEFYGDNHRGDRSYIVGLLNSKIEKTIDDATKKYGWSFD